MFFAGGRDAELFSELWRACAGPLVELPQPGQRVFYFLQGHLEQVLGSVVLNSPVFPPSFSFAFPFLLSVCRLSVSVSFPFPSIGE